jgi:hypothetical protein
VVGHSLYHGASKVIVVLTSSLISPNVAHSAPDANQLLPNRAQYRVNAFEFPPYSAV